jgi:colanic acid biosynthesis protein WcaH
VSEPTDTPETVPWIDDDAWETIVRNVPIVSVDLVVLTGTEVVLAERQNRPAKGEWFVPGGRVHKGERLEAAVHRVAREELGIGVEIRASLGAYEHLYAEAEVGVAESGGKHYLANAFVVETTDEPTAADAQHGAVRTFGTPPSDLHPYVRTYLDDASEVVEWL